VEIAAVVETMRSANDHGRSEWHVETNSSTDESSPAPLKFHASKPRDAGKK
jgi:hypothetical protein